MLNQVVTWTGWLEKKVQSHPSFCEEHQLLFVVTLLNKKGLPFCTYNYQKNAQTIPVTFPNYFQLGSKIISKHEFNPVMAQIRYVLIWNDFT